MSQLFFVSTPLPPYLCSWATELDQWAAEQAAGAPSGTAGADAAVGAGKLPVSTAALRRAWESSQRVTKEDWAEWQRNFTVELLRQSSSPALRACCELSQVGHTTLGRAVVNADIAAEPGMLLCMGLCVCMTELRLWLWMCAGCGCGDDGMIGLRLWLRLHPA